MFPLTMLTGRILSLLCILMVSGCSQYQSLGKFPNENEYYLPKSELIKRYPVISMHEMKWGKKKRGCIGFGCILNLAQNDEEHEGWIWPRGKRTLLEEEVIRKLGQPNDISREWVPLLGGPFLLYTFTVPIDYALVGGLVLFPMPIKHSRFKKGNYCIETTFWPSIFTGYRSVLMGWKWLEDDCAVLKKMR